MIYEPVDWSRRRLTPRKCYRIFFVRGQIRGCKSKSCGMNEHRATPQVGMTEEAHGRARGKHSASGQAKTACPCDDYSKKHSLVECKSTALLTQPKKIDLKRSIENRYIIHRSIFRIPQPKEFPLFLLGQFQLHLMHL
jgi:hypothetical protein